MFLTLIAIAVLAGGPPPLETLWVTDYNGPADGQDFAERVFPDDAGNLYVIGGSAQTGSPTDLMAAKFAPDGSTLWFRTLALSTSGGYHYAYAGAIDDDGNLYSTGTYYLGPAGTTIPILKYDAAGDLLWSREYWFSSGGNSSNQASDLVVGTDGAVYVCGMTSAHPTPGDMVLLKYDADGTLLWTRHYNGAFNGWDRGRRLAIDADGNIIVLGESQVGAVDDDIVIWKYAPNGDLIWQQFLGHPAGRADFSNAMRIGPDQSIYLAGYARVDPDPDSEDDDAFIARFDTNGALEWQTWYGHASLRSDKYFALVVDPAGNAYATGVTEIGFDDDFVVTRVDATGRSAWTRQFGEVFEETDQGDAIDLDEQGNVLVGGESVRLLDGAAGGDGGKDPPIEYGFRFLSYTPDGDLRYESFQSLGDERSLQDARALPGGEIVAVGNFHTDATDQDFYVARWLETFDCNGNGLPDEQDIDRGTSQDCNGNGTPDECDIAAGTALDCNGNGVPDACDIDAGILHDDDASGVADECEAIGDLDGDGSVGATDLAILLGGWGSCRNCPADLDGDGAIGPADLAILLGNWG
ncbi:MAG: hypothetical protein KDA25_06460 [Phycisphaerales bacterium]|nr:hypothetical protein [Phycisphaerales bacterium]